MQVGVMVAIKLFTDTPYESDRERMARETAQSRLDYIADQLAKKIDLALDSWPADARHVEVIFKVS